MISGELIAPPIEREWANWPSPGAKLLAGNRGNPLGCYVFRWGAALPLVILDIDTHHCRPQFNPKGNLIVLGGHDGSVLLCDLPEINRRLTEVGLGW